YYDQITQTKDELSYAFPLEVEQRLINLVKSGNTNETMKLLKTIHNDMIASRSSSPDMVKLLVFDLSATVFKLSQEITQLNEGEDTIPYQDLIEQISSLPTFHASYEAITNVFTQLCQYVNNQKKSHNVELKDRIINYINENYRDGSLSLA